MTQGDAPRLAFIGFGEAAEAFATGWGAEAARRVRAYDLKSDDSALAELPRARAARCGVLLSPDRASALKGAQAVFCLVTADRAVEAAAQSAAYLAPGAFWLDGNSCSPGAKRKAAEIVEGVGARYVDVAIMAPVHPRLHLTPLLIAGPHVNSARLPLSGLGMQAEIAGPAVGDASSIKMIRSVMVKGMEALTAECLLAARRAGVEEQVLASLKASNPAIEWSRQAAYNLERMLVHGRRRAAEMREVAVTLAELGLPNGLASATTDWQQRIGELDLPPGRDEFLHRADMILDALARGGPLSPSS